MAFIIPYSKNYFILIVSYSQNFHDTYFSSAVRFEIKTKQENMKMYYLCLKTTFITIFLQSSLWFIHFLWHFKASSFHLQKFLPPVSNVIFNPLRCKPEYKWKNKWIIDRVVQSCRVDDLRFANNIVLIPSLSDLSYKNKIRGTLTVFLKNLFKVF